jgi:hypothetical protein
MKRCLALHRFVRKLQNQAKSSETSQMQKFPSFGRPMVTQVSALVSVIAWPEAAVKAMVCRS